MDRCFPKILRDYTSKQKRENLFISLNKKLSVKINPTACFKSFIGPGNGGGGGAYFVNPFIFTTVGPNGGGGGSHLYNKLSPNFKIKVKR